MKLTRHEQAVVRAAITAWQKLRRAGAEEYDPDECLFCKDASDDCCSCIPSKVMHMPCCELVEFRAALHVVEHYWIARTKEWADACDGVIATLRSWLPKKRGKK